MPTPAQSGGKPPADRVVPPKLFARRRDFKAGEGISASLCVGAQLKLTILDAHTGEPVKGAAAKRVDVEHLAGSHDPLVKADQDFFDLPYPPPPWAPEFTQADEDALKAKLDPPVPYAPKGSSNEKWCLPGTRGSVGTSSESEKARYAQAVEILAKRQVRRDWCKYLQCAVKLLIGWKSEKTYDGPVDGTGFGDFEKVWLAPVYKMVTGKVYTDKPPKGGKASYMDVSEKLYDAIAKMFVTDQDGVLLIPLPVDHKGTVTIEMATLKVLHPADAAKIGTAEKTRAAYAMPPGQKTKKQEQKEPGDYKPDLPGSTEELSKWSLESGPKSFQFRNFIKVDYDTTSVTAVEAPIEMSTFALVFCQPSWFEAGPKDYLVEPSDVMAEDDHRGLKDGHPTFLVSASFMPRGQWYGSYGAEGRVETVNFNILNFVLEDPPNSDQYYWLKQDAPSEITITDHDADQAKLDARLLAKEPNADCRRMYRIRKADREVADGTGKMVDPKKNKDYTYITEWFRSWTYAGTLGAAVEEASRMLSGNDKVVKQDKDGRWYLYRPDEEKNRDPTRPGEDPPLLRSRSYDSLQDCMNNELTKKTHHGIDCAGDEGDPVFAICGGVMNNGGDDVYNNNSKPGGLRVNLAAWHKDLSGTIQYLHLREHVGATGMRVKAGDVIGIMGRTGNPVAGSPTHTHFHIYRGNSANISLATCILPSHPMVMPCNDRPKLLPCAANWGYRDNPPPQDDPKTARQCRAKTPSNKDNIIANTCWAMLGGRCPHMTQLQWADLKAADAAERKRLQQEEAEKKKQQKEAERKAKAGK